MLKLEEPFEEVEALLPIELGLEPMLGGLALMGKLLLLEGEKEGLLPPLKGVLVPELLPPSELPVLLPLLSPEGLADRPDPLEVDEL